MPKSTLSNPFVTRDHTNVHDTTIPSQNVAKRFTLHGKSEESMQVHSYTETNQEKHIEKRSFETPTYTCEREERVIKPWFSHSASSTRKLRKHGGSESFKGGGKRV